MWLDAKADPAEHHAPGVETGDASSEPHIRRASQEINTGSSVALQDYLIE